ncbi:MAG: NAD(+)/NADH kinase [Bacteroidetes bacterium]|nr:NAD(+)/NADH kinase [Bacteroidota bacterium]
MHFGIYGNVEKREIVPVVQLIIERFWERGIDFCISKPLASIVRKVFPRTSYRTLNFVSDHKIASMCDIIISVGGDGTILRLARLVCKTGTPILGVNVGKLGFLAEVSVEELNECLDELLRGEYRIEKRSMLETTIGNEDFPERALNDVVINCSGSSRMISIQTFVNDDYLATFRGDGIIIATPTGSTAYALSNGGPIVQPSTEVLLISPICPHTLTVRTVVVPDNSTIRMRVEYAPAKVHVAIDGQPQTFIKSPVQVEVKKSNFYTSLVKRKNINYYDVLRRKLNWGKDVRTNT